MLQFVSNESCLYSTVHTETVDILLANITSCIPCSPLDS